MITGTGEVTAQLPTAEVFGDTGAQTAFGNRPAPTEKGQRLVYRPLDTSCRSCHAGSSTGGSSRTSLRGGGTR